MTNSEDLVYEIFLIEYPSLLDFMEHLWCLWTAALNILLVWLKMEITTLIVINFYWWMMALQTTLPEDRFPFATKERACRLMAISAGTGGNEWFSIVSTVQNGRFKIGGRTKMQIEVRINTRWRRKQIWIDVDCSDVEIIWIIFWGGTLRNVSPNTINAPTRQND